MSHQVGGQKYFIGPFDPRLRYPPGTPTEFSFRLASEYGIIRNFRNVVVSIKALRR
jgi:hypothetical protein